MATDSYEDRMDRERRIPVPTDKGEQLYEQRKESLVKKVKSSSFMLNETIKTFTHSSHIPSLVWKAPKQIYTQLTNAMTKILMII